MSADFKSPQPAPWPAGTRLKYVGDSVSGFTNDAGEAVWCHRHGVLYDVIDVHLPGIGSEKCTDHETGERWVSFPHGWSILQSVLDPDRKHMKGIDVESMHDYELIRS